MRWLYVLLLIPVAHAYIFFYTAGYSSSDYHRAAGDAYVQGSDFPTILEAVKEWGFDDVLWGDRVDTKADAIVVLGCTDTVDAQALKEYVKQGGGLVVDVFCLTNTSLAKEFGIFTEGDYEGAARSSVAWRYATILNGYYVGDPIKARDSPVWSGYEAMVYVGPALSDVGGFLRPAFVTESGQGVLYWGEYGKGRVVVTGCLLCANQMLFANILDWVADGKIDFPPLTVRRTVSENAYVGEEIVEKIDVEGEGVNVKMEYRYGEEESCDPAPRVDVETMTITHTPEKEGTCYLPPVTVVATWDAGDGTEYVREFTLQRKIVHVLPPKDIYVGREIRLFALGLLALALIVIALKWKTIVRKYYEMRIRRIEYVLEKIEREYMMRKIPENVRNELVQKYNEKKFQLIESLSQLEGKDKEDNEKNKHPSKK